MTDTTTDTPFAPLTDDALKDQRDTCARIAARHLVRGDTDLALARAEQYLAYEDAIRARTRARLARYDQADRDQAAAHKASYYRAALSDALTVAADQDQQ